MFQGMSRREGGMDAGREGNRREGDGGKTEGRGEGDG